MITIEQARFYIEKQRAEIGMPPITSVDAGLCEDWRFVMVYVETTVGETLTACFELPTPMTQDEFDAARASIEAQFQSLSEMSDSDDQIHRGVRRT